MSLLEITGLRVGFDTEDGEVHAVREISLSLEPGEILALCGESGCGKSVTAMSIPRLLPPDTTRLSGSIRLDDRELTGLPEKDLRELRGKDVSVVFQEPMTSLNPSFTVGFQIAEVLRRHEGLSRQEARARAVELLELVGIPAPARRIKEYPHQLSGGMRQRVMIAIAVACSPRVLIADEPTTALDVTIQAGVLDVFRDLRDRLGTAIILITHDLGVVADIADRAVVMYAGRAVERGAGDRAVRPAPPPVHRGAHAGPAGLRGHPRRRAQTALGDPGPGPAAVRRPGRVRVPPALPPRPGRLPRDPAAPGGTRPRPPRRLLPPTHDGDPRSA